MQGTSLQIALNGLLSSPHAEFWRAHNAVVRGPRSDHWRADDVFPRVLLLVPHQKSVFYSCSPIRPPPLRFTKLFTACLAV